MGSFAERLVEAIRVHPGETDRFLTEFLFGRGRHPAQVNQEARLLSARGQIARRRRSDGRWGNFPVAFSVPSQPLAPPLDSDRQDGNGSSRPSIQRKGQASSMEARGEVLLTRREQTYCAKIADRIDRLRALLNERALEKKAAPAVWYDFLSALKEIQGNTSNDLSFIATLLAKRYLAAKHGVDFCAAEKPQGAPGIDIDVKDGKGDRVVSEIKTTMPYQGSDFGAQQAAMFKKDFAKLTAAQAKHKYLFVTEPAAFNVLKKPKYVKLMPGVRIVLLKTNEEHDA